MRFNTRNLFLALALGAFTMTASSGWASMMPVPQQTQPGSHPMQTTPGTQPTHQYSMHKTTTSQTKSISGTIVKSGGSYVLRASNGQEYQLSGSSRAKSYVGKTVTVKGKVNVSSHVIDVQSIQPQ